MRGQADISRHWRRLHITADHLVHADTRSSGVQQNSSSAAATAAKAIVGGGGALLAGHVAYEWRKHGLVESWRKSLKRKGRFPSESWEFFLYA